MKTEMHCNCMKHSSRLLQAALFAAALLAAGSALAQNNRNANPPGESPAAALPPDSINASARVEVRQSAEGAYELRIGNDTFRTSDWVQIEKRAIELLPDRTITFVNPAGDVLHVSPRAMFGVLLEPVSGVLAAQLNVKPGEALTITEVQPNLPAARAGLEVYDVIVACNGRRPMTMAQFSEIMASAVPGDLVNVVLVRRGRETELAVRLDRYDPVAMAQVRPPLISLNASDNEQVIRDLIEAARPTSIAVPKTDPQTGMAMPQHAPVFPDPNSKALQEELAGIKAQLRRIEEVLTDLLLLEQQRQDAAGKSVGG
ncbi:MAG: PDZ domain-containing protein [Phycisphaerales bacterium]|nr:PDZ domain-containing protein [Phycisphaerales bacterium]